jgi:hypothetical protein
MKTIEAMDALARYRDNRQELGGFLTAMLENDLANTIRRADKSSWANLKEIFNWLWNEMPANAWGSPEAVSTWLHPEQHRPRMSDYAMMVTATECPGCGQELPAHINYHRAIDGWPLAGWDVLMGLTIHCRDCSHDWPLDTLGVPRPEVRS